MDAVCHQLLNQLSLLQPAGFTYAARPPAATGRRGRQRRVGAAAASSGLDDDDELVTVYGSYAAVTLCDCR